MCRLVIQTRILTEQLPVPGRQPVNSLERRGPAGWASWGPEEGHGCVGCAGGRGTFFRDKAGRGLLDGKVAPHFCPPQTGQKLEEGSRGEKGEPQPGLGVPGG